MGKILTKSKRAPPIMQRSRPRTSGVGVEVAVGAVLSIRIPGFCDMSHAHQMYHVLGQELIDLQSFNMSSTLKGRGAVN